MLRLLVIVSLCASVFQLTECIECKDTSTGLTYQPGDKVKVPGVCNEKTCQPNGYFTSTGCALYQVSKGYHMEPENPLLPFPDCCAHPVRNTFADFAKDLE